jgi:hypothetical protein
MESNLKRIAFLEKKILKNKTKPIYEPCLRLQDVQNRIKLLLPLENVSKLVSNFNDFLDEILAGKRNYTDYLYQIIFIMPYE